MELHKEQEKITELLKGKSINKVFRHRSSEIVIIFTDGSSLTVDGNGDELEFSITGPKLVSGE